MMHGPEKSDSVVVAMKPTNKAGLDWGRSRNGGSWFALRLTVRVPVSTGEEPDGGERS
jgi:hypothetical protein